ncbi:invasion associated locus B family protein [Thalassovita mediterranea]|nr:invasion associated locus B family protein [Thalassovita mediterranea]
MIRFAATAALCAAVAIPAALAAPTAIGRYDDWTVFTEQVGGEKLCYAATEATDKAPQSANHGDVWFFVSNWASGKARSQPSLKVGYDLRADLPARASVGRSGWTLYGVGGEAFAQDRDDSQIVDALRRGSELHVEAVSSRNTQVSYHFSLSGSAAAIDKASSLCR